MILSNKYIKIQTNKQNVVSHNYIFDKYLEFVNKSQFKTEINEELDRYNQKKIAGYCMLKFDEPIVDYQNITYEDFDAMIYMQSYNVSGKNNQCNCTYIYNSSDSFTSVDNPNENLDINDYVGHKVTALAFSNGWHDRDEGGHYTYNPDILAYIDVSEYNITITQDEKIVITRSDDFASNMYCDGIDFPKHLAPYYMYSYADDTDESPIYARLYSIGFGASRGIMQEEYKLDNNEIEIEKTDTDFSFWLKTGEKRTIYPKTTLHPSNRRYPMKDYQYIEQYPGVNLHPSNSRYPMKANAKYIIFKYKLCYYNYEQELIDMENEYTMSYYSPVIAYYKVKNKIERRTN